MSVLQLSGKVMSDSSLSGCESDIMCDLEFGDSGLSSGLSSGVVSGV